MVCSLQQEDSFLNQTVPKTSVAEKGGGMNTTKEVTTKRVCLELGKNITWLVWFEVEQKNADIAFWVKKSTSYNEIVFHFEPLFFFRKVYFSMSHFREG